MQNPLFYSTGRRGQGRDPITPILRMEMLRLRKFKRLLRGLSKVTLDW